MAASACMHSVFTTPIAQTSRTSSLLVPSLRLPRQQKSGMQIRCLAEEGQTTSTPTPTPTPVSATSPPPTPTPSPPPKPKVSTKFGDVFAFSGPAPERINGRLAMIGFVAAIGAELAKGDDVVAQLANGGLPWFIGTSVLFTLASLIPLFKGVSVDSKSSGVMTSSAEMWNGRFAMLGLVALVFTEFVKGGALV